MKRREEEEKVWRPSNHINGYDSRGPLISHPAPYCHTAYCNTGQLVTRIRPEKPKEPKPEN